MEANLAELRKNYSRQSLSEKDIYPDPVLQFKKWWDEAMQAGIDEPNAMTLATASAQGLPSARIVLLKGFSDKGFIFFTNYESYKGQQLAENPKACLVFFWKELERQVRITGLVKRVDPSESDTYFHSRPVSSQLGAIASPQSRVIESREWLDAEYQKTEKGLDKGLTQRPANWGGYIVTPIIIEFWQGRPSRLHDRIQYTLTEKREWQIERLAP